MMKHIAKSPIQKALLLVGVILSVILQYPQPKLDVSYYTYLASNHTGNKDEVQPLKGSTCVITGATSGLGLDLTKHLFRLGATVVAIGRSESKLSALSDQLLLQQQQQEERIVLIQANLQDLKSVSNAANKIKSRFKTIDFLINNAGMTHASHGTDKKPKPTPQGYDEVFAVNYLSHFLLTEKLLPNLKRSKVQNGARIVQIASSMHLMVDGNDLVPGSGNEAPLASQPIDSSLHRIRSYGNSKLAQIYHARSLARELDSLSSASSSSISKLKVVSVCPSWVATHIAGAEFKSVLDIFAFRSDGYGLASILFAMFHGDVGATGFNNNNNNNNKDQHSKDYVTNCGILGGKLLSVIDKLVAIFPVRYYRETLTWLGGMGLLLFQKAFASVDFRPTSREGYNVEQQDALYQWSKEAVKPWM